MKTIAAIFLTTTLLMSTPAMAGMCIGKFCIGDQETQTQGKSAQKSTTTKQASATKTTRTARGKATHRSAKYSKKQCKNPAVKAYKTANLTMHKGMDIAYTGNPDIDFVEGMMPHHQGAVDMVDVVLKYGKDPEIKKLAQWIKTQQISEIAHMKTWIAGKRSAWRADDVDQHEDVIAYKKIMTAMHQGMHIDYTGDADVDFARGMIPHHQGAVEMAKVLVEHGRDPELRKFAWEIIRGQGQEIKKMQEWLKKQGK